MPSVCPLPWVRVCAAPFYHARGGDQEGRGALEAVRSGGQVLRADHSAGLSAGALSRKKSDRERELRLHDRESSGMRSRERVLSALRHQKPDPVPYVEIGVDPAVADRLRDLGQEAGYMAYR